MTIEERKKTDAHYMKKVFVLAKKGIGRVSPNPLVGALIVKNGQIIGKGWHREFGGSHAEIEAINDSKQKGYKLSGATLYSNLEPCVHLNKKTPPCVPQLVDSGIKRIVLSNADPNVNVNGLGIKALKKAGISISENCLKREGEILNEKYFKWIKTGMPFVGLKIAMSLDGKIATKSGDSKWISCDKSRAFVRKLRDSYDAVLVGINTVLRDDPSLSGEKFEPLRVILDSKLRINLSNKVMRDKNVMIVTTEKRSRSKMNLLTKRKIPFQIFDNKIGINPLLSRLAKQGISSVLVEGGAEIFGSFIDAGAVDRFYWFISPKIIGGEKAKSAVKGTGISKMSECMPLNFTHRKIGNDILMEAVKNA